jgi:uncharacterized protein YdeI (YjbR/CyaY-like superfamily)
MSDEIRFRATLEGMPRGGHAVDVDPKKAPKRANDIVPFELEKRLQRSKPAREAWDALAPSHRREWIGSINDAERQETRERRADALTGRG